MRLSMDRTGRITRPAFAVAVALLLTGCQSGGTAVSSYSGAQFADAITTSQKNFRVTTHDRNSSTRSGKKLAKAEKVPLPDASERNSDAPVQSAALGTDATATPSAGVIVTDTAALSDNGPTVIAALRSDPMATLPGVGDPFAQVTEEGVLPSARPDTVPSKREINGADMPLLATSNPKVHQRRAKYASIIRKHAQAHGVPVKLAMAVVQIESMYRPGAVGTSGEIGLMQILPRTARFIGYKGSMKALHDPETNISYGMKYLGKAHRLGGGSTCGTILKYNAGHGAKKMNSVSREYCRRVSRILQET